MPIDLGALSGVWGSIMGSQEREFEHQASMQSRSLSAQSGMHKSSLANALKIAKMGNETQRYGIDVGAETARRGQDFSQEQARWTNALNYLSMAAQLRGPDDWLSYLNFTRGAAAGDAPAFLKSLMDSMGLVHPSTELGLPDWAPIPGGQVNAPSMAGLSAAMGGPGGGVAAGGGTSQDAVANTINMVRTAANNMGRLPGGALEDMSEDERNFFLGTAGSLGYSVPSLLDSYQRSRIGQGSARAA